MLVNTPPGGAKRFTKKTNLFILSEFKLVSKKKKRYKMTEELRERFKAFLDTNSAESNIPLKSAGSLAEVKNERKRGLSRNTYIVLAILAIIVFMWLAKSYFVSKHNIDDIEKNIDALLEKNYEDDDESDPQEIVVKPKSLSAAKRSSVRAKDPFFQALTIE